MIAMRVCRFRTEIGQNKFRFFFLKAGRWSHIWSKNHPVLIWPVDQCISKKYILAYKNNMYGKRNGWIMSVEILQNSRGGRKKSINLTIAILFKTIKKSIDLPQNWFIFNNLPFLRGGREKLPLLFQQRGEMYVFNLKQHCTDRSAYDIKVPRERFESTRSICSL